LHPSAIPTTPDTGMRTLSSGRAQSVVRVSIYVISAWLTR
jgi:hypothetical protein